MLSTRGLLRRAYNGCNKRIGRILFSQFSHFQAHDLSLQSLGHGDGAWTVPIDLIRPDWTCYCVGVGVDATFDIALSNFVTNVFSFDPTPRSIAFMEALDYDRNRISFHPIGIWNENEKLRFYAPMNRQHANYSTQDIHGTSEYFVADCKKLTTIMDELGHEHIDLLKLDIEGSWYEVLMHAVNAKIQISVLCVEFDSPTSFLKVTRMIRALNTIGLKLVHRERDNFLFLHEKLLSSSR